MTPTPKTPAMADNGEPQFCDQSGCLRRVFPPYIYCDSHQDKSSTPVQPQADTVEQILREAKEKTQSDDPLVHVAWLIDGIGVYLRTNGKRGHSVEDCKRYVVSSVSALLHTEREAAYQRGRIDEAKTCEQTKRHDHSQVRQVLLQSVLHLIEVREKADGGTISAIKLRRAIARLTTTDKDKP